MTAVKKILFVTGSRSEYGYIRPILRLIEQDPNLDYCLVVSNMHLLASFGNTIEEIKKDGFRIDYAPQMTLAATTPASMMKSLYLFGLSITDILEREQPDFILLAGDRGEQLITAITGNHLNLPVAHIQAGELSGNVDGQTRHAIARYAHLHFAANEDAAIRLKKSGEQESRIFNVGAPQLDEFLDLSYQLENIYKKYHLKKDQALILLLQHSVTEEFNQAKQQMQKTLTAISKFSYPTIIIHPNCDAGSHSILEALNEYQQPFFQIYPSIPRSDYLGLLSIASVLVGNSSSGIIEAPSMHLPVVNIGRRQEGRMRAENVIDCPEFEESLIHQAVIKALSPEFKASLKNISNPYGDGKSSQRILTILKNTQLNQNLLFKKITY